MPHRLLAAMFLAVCLSAAPLGQAHAAAPAKAQPILTVDQVKVGMKGYGMTVFHGTKIEPFNVEVVTISANETPNRAVIWVRCTDKRMIHTGPVQGMSGSPIYLWGENEPKVLGKGGKLIGAFAFGYGNTNECVVGVQPIQYMRAVGKRATASDRPSISMAAPPGAGLALLSRLHSASKTQGLPDLTVSRIAALKGLYQTITPGAKKNSAKTNDGKLPMDKPEAADRSAKRMMLPMSVGSGAIAKLLGPAFNDQGIQPFAVDPAALGGKPPRGFKTKGVELKPGSALVVPFAWGDADLSGAGTVTDVLPDGTVLGFGHAMDGIGVTAMPMATGYVHFIVSLSTISYKRSGTLELKGALVQDEQAAVAGTSDKPYTSAPVKVDVNIQGQPKYSYDYQVLNHPRLTPMIAGAVVAQSTMAVQGAPLNNTARFTTELEFSSGHKFEFYSEQIGAGGVASAAFAASVIGAMTQNPFEQVTLKRMKTKVDVDYGVDAYEVVSAKLDKASYQPGETASITLQLQGLYEKMTTQTIKYTIPKDMPVGETMINLSGAAQYTGMVRVTRPELSQIKSVDDLAKAVKAIYSAKPKSLYLLMPTRKLGLALNGQRLDNLPASKALVLGQSTPWASTFQSYQVTEVPMKRMILGGSSVRLKIVRPTGAR